MLSLYGEHKTQNNSLPKKYNPSIKKIICSHMKNYIYFLDLYKKASRWSILKDIYSCQTKPNKIAFSISFTLLIAMLVAIITVDIISWFIIYVIYSTYFFWLFSSMKKNAFSELYKSHPDEMKAFSFDYVYVRYQKFKTSCLKNDEQKTPLTNKELNKTINFINTIIEPPKNPVFTHPVITLITGIFLAIIGGCVGSWDKDTVLKVLTLLVVLGCLNYIFIDIYNDRKLNIHELRKFLFWMNDELEKDK